MKNRIFTLIILLLTITYSTIAQDRATSDLSLPEGAIARINKGKLAEVKYSHDGTQLAIASSTGIWIYDTNTWHPQFCLTSGEIEKPFFDYHSKTSTLASYDDNRYINLWDTETGKLIHQIMLLAFVNNLVINANGDTLAISHYDGKSVP